jgi:hypothetical protein
MARPRVAIGGTASSRRVAANILNKQCGQPARGGPPSWGLGDLLATPHRKNVSCCKTVKE